MLVYQRVYVIGTSNDRLRFLFFMAFRRQMPQDFWRCVEQSKPGQLRVCVLPTASKSLGAVGNSTGESLRNPLGENPWGKSMGEIRLDFFSNGMEGDSWGNRRSTCWFHEFWKWEMGDVPLTVAMFQLLYTWDDFPTDEHVFRRLRMTYHKKKPLASTSEQVFLLDYPHLEKHSFASPKIIQLFACPKVAEDRIYPWKQSSWQKWKHVQNSRHLYNMYISFKRCQDVHVFCITVHDFPWCFSIIPNLGWVV